MKLNTQKAMGMLLLIALIAGVSCKKDNDGAGRQPSDFNGISISHVKAIEPALSEAEIYATESGNILWNTGDVFVFKTNKGVYGKFKVVGINAAQNDNLVINAEIFNADGSTLQQNENLLVRGTWTCDLDSLKETSIGANADFHWRRTQNNTILNPYNGAKYSRYNFP